MRIIAGQWRGRPIIAPAGESTRPTSDRARETLFSMLTSRLGGFTGLVVADVFAGSGALGLEALSRGASACLFLDSDRAAIAAIRSNLATLQCASGQVRQSSALGCPPPAVPCDLILLDPPYGWADLSRLLGQLSSAQWLKPGGWLSVETARDTVIDAGALTPIVHRQVGKAALHLLQAR